MPSPAFKKKSSSGKPPSKKGSSVFAKKKVPEKRKYERNRIFTDSEEPGQNGFAWYVHDNDLLVCRNGLNIRVRKDPATGLYQAYRRPNQEDYNWEQLKPLEGYPHDGSYGSARRLATMHAAQD